MKCPRCEALNLDEMERGGIVIDRCDSCRGVWLDRGELEKLIARARLEEIELEPRTTDRRPHFSRDDDDADRRLGAPRKRSWLQNLGEFFD